MKFFYLLTVLCAVMLLAPADSSSTLAPAQHVRSLEEKVHATWSEQEAQGLLQYVLHVRSSFPRITDLVRQMGASKVITGAITTDTSTLVNWHTLYRLHILSASETIPSIPAPLLSTAFDRIWESGLTDDSPENLSRVVGIELEKLFDSIQHEGLFMFKAHLAGLRYYIAQHPPRKVLTDIDDVLLFARTVQPGNVNTRDTHSTTIVHLNPSYDVATGVRLDSFDTRFIRETMHKVAGAIKRSPS